MAPVSARINDKTMRAKDGVISGRKVTAAPSLSRKLYICSVISSPAFRL